MEKIKKKEWKCKIQPFYLLFLNFFLISFLYFFMQKGNKSWYCITIKYIMHSSDTRTNLKTITRRSVTSISTLLLFFFFETCSSEEPHVPRQGHTVISAVHKLVNVLLTCKPFAVHYIPYKPLKFQVLLKVVCDTNLKSE